MTTSTENSSYVGVAVVMVVAVVVVILTIFGVSRGVMNNAQTSFVRTMDGTSTAGLSDFDGTTISAVKVRSAIEDYEGQPYFILVNTAALQKKYNPNGEAKTTTSGKGADAVRTALKTREKYADDSNSGLQLVAFSGRMYAIYNAQVQLKDDNGALLTGSAAPSFTDSKEGYISFDGAFETVDGLIQFNTQKINWKTSGCTEYLSNSSNFVSKLIKDASGTTVGIMFTEVY